MEPPLQFLRLQIKALLHVVGRRNKNCGHGENKLWLKAHGVKLRNILQYHFRGQLDLWRFGLLCLCTHGLGRRGQGGTVHTVRLALIHV